jgi:hypothetical protein
VLFTRGGKDYAAQNDWHNSQSRQERDEFRIWAMGKVEAGLTASDRLLVQQARQTVKPVIADTLNAAVAAGTWRHPTLGGTVSASRQTTNAEPHTKNASGQGIVGTLTSGMGTGRFGAYNDANGTNSGASGIHRLATRAERAQQGRKRDREDEDDDDQDQGQKSQGESEPSRVKKSILRPVSRTQPASHQASTQRIMKRGRDVTGNVILTPSTRFSKKAHRSGIAGTVENLEG